MSTTILFAAATGLTLLVWFRTDAWLEYTKLFRLNWLSHYKDFEVKSAEDVSLTYHVYLRRYHDSFLIRLITCPICLAIWIGVIFSILQFMLLMAFSIFTIAFIPVAITSLFYSPIHILLGLAIFATLDKLLR